MQSTKEVRQCWAFNMDGQRCDHPAGHPGKHVVSKEWEDADCIDPSTLVQVSVQEPVSTYKVVAPLPEVQQAPIPCVACHHHHKGGSCKCGCHEYIG